MKILEGKTLANTLKQQIKQEVQTLKQNNVNPHIAIILVGDNVASQFYVSNKIKICKELKIQTTLFSYDHPTEDKILKCIQEINNNSNIHGLIVQLPLPPSINTQKVIHSIHPTKDIDGLHHFNYGRMIYQLPTLIPATPMAVLMLLKHYRIRTKGKHCVILGKSFITGLPLSILLSQNHYPGNATVTLCNKTTTNLHTLTSSADILITAIGKPNFIQADMIKENSIIIDVGTSYIKQQSHYQLMGDVNFNQVLPKCKSITPVPGGIGPLTITALLLNTLKSIFNKYKKKLVYPKTPYL